MNKDIKESIYKYYGHSKTRLRYHLIFVTKYRRKCLTDIKYSVIESFKMVEANSHIKIHNINTDRDHVHMIISFPPEYSLSQTVNRLKQFTTNQLYKTNYDHLKKFYWGKKKVLWSHSYFCSTIGRISESRVQSYINNQ